MCALPSHRYRFPFRMQILVICDVGLVHAQLSAVSLFGPRRMSGAFEWLRRPWKPVASEGGIIRVARGVLEAVVERETGKK